MEACYPCSLAWGQVSGSVGQQGWHQDGADDKAPQRCRCGKADGGGAIWSCLQVQMPQSQRRSQEDQGNRRECGPMAEVVSELRWLTSSSTSRQSPPRSMLYLQQRHDGDGVCAAQVASRLHQEAHRTARCLRPVSLDMHAISCRRNSGEESDNKRCTARLASAGTPMCRSLDDASRSV